MVFRCNTHVCSYSLTDLDDPDANSCAGNHYSKPVTVSLSDVQARVVEIVADQVIEDTMDTSTNEWMECVQMRSELLSDYHNQDVYMYAAVVLPKEYHAQRAAGVKFPTLYYIEGFTGTESYADRGRAFLNSPMGDDWKAGKWPTPMLRVTLGSRFKFGHTSFADSETNGPWGTALVSEFIPYLESKFPMIAASGCASAPRTFVWRLVIALAADPVPRVLWWHVEHGSGPCELLVVPDRQHL
ncbi:hypothetical protein PINS_up006349 [Pythium insidiosum]|nr:hypothetical protein PINS_up006349 [Pythium insidiosum]